MIEFEAALELARALEGATESIHFGGSAVSAHGRIFATFWPEKSEANLRLTLEEQRRFVEESDAFSVIPNAWGRQGATTVQLEFVTRPLFTRALESAWTSSAVAFSRPTTKSPSSKPRRNSKR